MLENSELVLLYSIVNVSAGECDFCLFRLYNRMFNRRTIDLWSMLPAHFTGLSRKATISKLVARCVFYFRITCLRQHRFVPKT
jgi:hypothetical protein